MLNKEIFHIVQKSNLEDKSPLIILLHGYGSNEKDLFSFKEYLPNDATVVSFRAPLELFQNMYAWYQIYFENNVKSFDEKSFVDIESDICVIPPNSFALARTVEYFKIPRNVLTVCLGKSTYARCGIIVNVTPLEPEWEGHVTLEFSNTTNLPAKIYAGEGVAQMLFFESDEECSVSYKDRGGKYQGQTGVTLPKT